MRQSYIFLICLSLFTSYLQANKPQNIDVSLQLNDITSSALIDIYYPYPEFDYSSIDTSSSESESELPVLVHMF